MIRICVALERPSWSYGARVGHASTDKCGQAFISLHPFLRGVYPLLTINSPKKIKMGAMYHYLEKISTASPFVATFPATNLLVFPIFKFSLLPNFLAVSPSSLIFHFLPDQSFKRLIACATTLQYLVSKENRRNASAMSLYLVHPILPFGFVT